MKKILIIAFAIFLFAQGLHAQNTNVSPTVAINANAFSNKIANKMRDSLNLTPQQRNQIKNINLQLHDKKMTARSQTTNRESLGRKLQEIENGRDSLYRKVLTGGQYNNYKQKKKELISNN